MLVITRCVWVKLSCSSYTPMSLAWACQINSSWESIVYALGSRNLDVSSNQFGGMVPPITGALVCCKCTQQFPLLAAVGQTCPLDAAFLTANEISLDDNPFVGVPL